MHMIGSESIEFIIFMLYSHMSNGFPFINAKELLCVEKLVPPKLPGLLGGLKAQFTSFSLEVLLLKLLQAECFEQYY